MDLMKAKNIAECIDLAVLLIVTLIGSYVLSSSTNQWGMLAGLLIICSLIPYQLLSNRVWRKIKARKLAEGKWHK